MRKKQVIKQSNILTCKSKKRNEFAVLYKKFFSEEWDIHLEIGSVFVRK